MKTAISLPDEVFESAEQLASKLGKSRSELYVNAIKKYIDRYKTDMITEQLNQVYGGNDQSITRAKKLKLDSQLEEMQFSSLNQTGSLNETDW